MDLCTLHEVKMSKIYRTHRVQSCGCGKSLARCWFPKLGTCVLGLAGFSTVSHLFDILIPCQVQISLNPTQQVFMFPIILLTQKFGQKSKKIIIWVFPKIGVYQNGWFITENPMNKWMIWGAHPYFWKHPYIHPRKLYDMEL